jgi:multiple sugar transport system ATP-binding protein
MATIRLINVVKRFDKLEAVKNLTLEIRDGEFMVLLGPSGCGKTTTLRSIAGLETVSEGEIWIDEQRVNDLHARDRDIAFVFQLYALYPHLTVERNIRFPLETQRVGRSEIRQRVQEVARLLQIEHLLAKKPRQLSGGDMQRVALGRAVIRRPKAFLMDEPIGTLDAKFREQMRTELKRLHIDIRATTIYVTHDQVEAMSMGDRIAIMNFGELQQVGNPAEVYNHPRNLFVANFIGSPGMNFLDVHCTVNGDRGIAVLASEHSIRFPIGKDLLQRVAGNRKDNGPIVLGIRPEWVRLSGRRTADSQKGEVYVVEPQGRYNIVDVKLGSAVVKAKTGLDFDLGVGNEVWVTLDERYVHLFDKASGKVLQG